MPSRIPYPYALAASSALVLLVYKLSTIGSSEPLAVLLGWLLELAALVVLAACWGACRRVRGLRELASVGFAVGALAVILPSLSHTYFFETARDRHFSLLAIDLRTLGFFFSQVLPVRGVVLLSGLLAAMLLGAWLLMKRGPRFEPRGPVSGALALGVALALLRVDPPLPTPLADLVGDARERALARQLPIDRGHPARFAARSLDRAGTPSHGRARYDKVLVFVMETMNSDLMEREATALPADTFVHSALPHAHRYERYFATNQDSRTAMLAMLSSHLIPYEAYTEAGRDHYMFLGQRPTLVDAMKREGYRSAFAVSQEEVELVVGDLPWDEVIHFDEGEVDPARAGGPLCFVPYEFEHGCEDLALLPRVLAFLDQNPRAFLFQEFIWGHASEYNQATGRTNTDYYSHYLDAVLSHLAQTGALASTLIVLSSDHGVREKDDQSRRESYRLPLWFYAQDLSAREDHALRSHLDFKDLLFAHSFGDAREPGPSPFVMVVGPTGTGFVTVLTEPTGMLLMQASEDTRRLVRAQGYGSQPVAEATAADYLRLLDDYRGYFSKL